MRIAVTSQNLRTVTGHAGKARRFLVYESSASGEVREVARLDLPLGQAMHSVVDGAPHPLDAMDVLITASCGDGFIRKMAQRGVRVILTGEEDPETAVHAYLFGHLKPPAPHQDGCERSSET